MRRLAVIISHPIQYYAPVFRMMHGQHVLDIKIFYTLGETKNGKYDHGFKKNITWDVPLLEGYDFEWVTNIAAQPGSHHSSGIINPGLIAQIDRWHPDALLIYGWSYHSHLAAMRHYKNKIPIFFRGDSTLIDSRSGWKAYFRTIYLKWVYRHIDHAFYVGANNRAYFKKFGLNEKQLTFSPHAVDNERFFLDRDVEAALLRKKLGLDEDNILVLFAGKLEQKKSPLLLLSAVKALKIPRVHLLFVGSGDLEGRLKASSDGDDNIHFLAFQNQSDMPVVYQACDLFCLPSGGPGETWGLAVNEAMASGKPVLVSDRVGAAVDLVIPGFSGEIFKAGDENDLKVKLQALLKDKQNLKQLGYNAKRKIADWSIFNQVITILETISKYGSE